MKKITIIETIRNLLIVAVLVIFGIGLDGVYHLYSDRMTFTYFIIATVGLALINLYAAKIRAVKS
jgi:hypothetical protein